MAVTYNVSKAKKKKQQQQKPSFFSQKHKTLKRTKQKLSHYFKTITILKNIQFKFLFSLQRALLPQQAVLQLVALRQLAPPDLLPLALDQDFPCQPPHLVYLDIR